MSLWFLIVGVTLLILAFIFLAKALVRERDEAKKWFLRSAACWVWSVAFLITGNLLDADMHGFSTWPIGPM